MSRAGTSSRSWARVEPERDERVAVGHEALGVGLARVLTLVGLGEAHRARLDVGSGERLGRPIVDDAGGHAAGETLAARQTATMRCSVISCDPDVAVELVAREIERAVGDDGMVARRADRRCRETSTAPASHTSKPTRQSWNHESTMRVPLAPRSMTAPVSQCSASCRSITLPRAPAPSTSTARIVCHAWFESHDALARIEQMDPPPAGLDAVVVDARAVGVREPDRAEVVTAFVVADHVVGAAADHDADSPPQAVLVVGAHLAAVRSHQRHGTGRDDVAGHSVVRHRP